MQHTHVLLLFTQLTPLVFNSNYFSLGLLDIQSLV